MPSPETTQGKAQAPAQDNKQDNAPAATANVPEQRPVLDPVGLQFLPAALEILETPASPVGRAIAATIAAAFTLAVIWASFSHIDIVATAQGKIVPSARTKTIQPLETGIVQAIHVQDGDHVSAGQVLIELDQTATMADQRRAAHDLLSARLDIARLSSLRATLNSDEPPQLLNKPDHASEADIEQVHDAMMAQAAEQEAKLASLDRQIQQKAAEAEQVKATIAKLDASMPYVEEGATIRRKAMDIQFGNRVAYLDAQTRFVEQQNERIVQQHKLTEIGAAGQALEKQFAQTKGTYAHQIFADLAEAERKAGEFAQDLVKAEQRASERVLRAPLEGTVQQLAIHTVGGVVTPAQQLMLVVPTDSKLEAEAMISNRDIGFVSEGQAAEVKVDTFNFTRYGLIEGKVVAVSRDAIIREKPQDPAARSKGGGALSESSEPAGQELLYSARIVLDRTDMQIDNKIVPLAPGMAVTVEVKTGSRRLIEYVMSPVLRYRQESLRER
jgi:hemolysin D